MSKIVKHNRLNTRLVELRRDLNQRQTRTIARQYGANFLDNDDVYSSHLASDETAHYFLAKRRKLDEKTSSDKTNSEKVNRVSDKSAAGAKTFVDDLVESDDNSLDSLTERDKMAVDVTFNAGNSGSYEGQSQGNSKNGPFATRKIYQKEKSNKRETFRPVIEIEEGSSDEYGDSDDDENLQAAIALSLRDQHHCTEGADTLGSSNNDTDSVEVRSDVEMENKSDEKQVEISLRTDRRRKRKFESEVGSVAEVASYGVKNLSTTVSKMTRSDLEKMERSKKASRQQAGTIHVDDSTVSSARRSQRHQEPLKCAKDQAETTSHNTRLARQVGETKQVEDEDVRTSIIVSSGEEDNGALGDTEGPSVQAPSDSDSGSSDGMHTYQSTSI